LLWTVEGDMEVLCTVAGDMEVMCTVAGDMEVMCLVAGDMELLCLVSGDMEVLWTAAGDMEVLCSVAGDMEVLWTVAGDMEVLTESIAKVVYDREVSFHWTALKYRCSNLRRNVGVTLSHIPQNLTSDQHNCGNTPAVPRTPYPVHRPKSSRCSLLALRRTWTLLPASHRHTNQTEVPPLAWRRADDSHLHPATS